jgi:predicted pyridoxine 5'-phosphate oxidase superfamily flavin-nucleotide-binding protein
MYREALKEWDANGWRIDTDTVARNRRKVAYAVPGPARRQQKGWVLDSIPLLGAEDAAKPKLKATG